MTWRKIPSDFQDTAAVAIGAEMTPPAGVAVVAAAALGDAATIATLPRDDDEENEHFHRTGSLDGDADAMSQLTTPSDIEQSDVHTQTSSTLTSATATAAALTLRLSTNVRDVLGDSLKILQGVPPPPRNSKINSNDTNNNGDVPPGQFIMMTNGLLMLKDEEDQEKDIHVQEEEDQDDDDNSLDFLQDDFKQMTIGRRIALALLNYPWYNPSIIGKKEEAFDDVRKGTETSDIPLNDTTNRANVRPELQSSMLPHADSVARLSTSNQTSIRRHDQRPKEPPTVTALEYPSLAKAWAYFEHVTLPRYFVPERDPSKPRKNIVVRGFRRIFCKANQLLNRAEPGESSHPTKLYDPVFTPLKQMGDFGLGIGLYFSTLRAMMLLTFFAGIINIPNFKFFAGPHYSDNRQSGVPKLLQGSAICPRASQIWVPCPNCTIDAGKNIPHSRLANATVLITNPATLKQEEQMVTFALRNFCFGATLQQGFVNYSTLIFFLVGILWLNYYLQKMEVKFDEDEQTAQDYSMVITNPPPDATDPEEWKNFLERNFTNCHVTVCTVAVDNDILVRSLVERREKMKRIEMLVEPGTRLDDISLSNIAARVERERRWYQHLLALVAPGIPELYGRVVVLNAKVQGLAQQEYPASNVFVCFETEAAQRQVLTTLSVGALAAKRHDERVLPDHKYLFRGTHVLQVEEPEEPNTIRWEDLNSPFLERSKALFWTTVATICAIVLIAFIVRLVNHSSAASAAITISIFNAIFPMFAKILTSLEAHPSEGSKQTSLFFKIALFRWVNTAIVYTIIRDFTSTLDVKNGIIPSIYAQFFAEIITSNAIQLLDPVGHLQRHFLAPRAKSQDAMNLNMQGQQFELAERYTNMTKLLFLAMWYCAIYPGAFFMCSFALLVIFFVDRFSLFRTWKPAPNLGTSISKFSRNYFFSLAVVAMAIVSSYYWSAFPFDNLCKNPDAINRDNFNVTSIRDFDGKFLISLSKAEADFTYRFCFQDLLRTHRNKVFPFTSMSQPNDNKWMTHAQEAVTNVYGWTSVAVVGIVVVSFLWRWWQSLQGLFKSTYEVSSVRRCRLDHLC